MNLLVFSNTFYQIVAKVASAGTTVLLTLFITRYFGAVTFGEYSIVMAYVLVYFLLADFGINTIVVKDFSQNKDNAKKNFSKILSFRILSGIVLSIIAIVVAYILPYEDHIRLAIVVAVPIIVTQAILKAPQVIFQAFMEYKYLAISTVVSSIFSLGIIYYLITNYQVSLGMLLATISFLSLILPITSLFFVKGYISFETKWIDIAYWTKFLKDAFPLGLALLVSGLMVQSDRIILSFLSVPISVGFYALAYRIFDFVLVLPTFFMNAYFPDLIRNKVKSEILYKKEIKKIIMLLVVVSVILTVCAVKYSSSVIGFVWGKEMVNASIPFNILMIGSVLFFVTSPLSWVFIVENEQKKLLMIYVFALCFNILFNFLLIPRFDYLGAAVVTVITEFIVFLYLGYQTYILLYKTPKVCQSAT